MALYDSILLEMGQENDKGPTAYAVVTQDAVTGVARFPNPGGDEASVTLVSDASVIFTDPGPFADSNRVQWKEVSKSKKAAAGAFISGAPAHAAYALPRIEDAAHSIRTLNFSTGNASKKPDVPGTVNNVSFSSIDHSQLLVSTSECARVYMIDQNNGPEHPQLHITLGSSSKSSVEWVAGIAGWLTLCLPESGELLVIDVSQALNSDAPVAVEASKIGPGPVKPKMRLRLPQNCNKVAAFVHASKIWLACWAEDSRQLFIASYFVALMSSTGLTQLSWKCATFPHDVCGCIFTKPNDHRSAPSIIVGTNKFSYLHILDASGPIELQRLRFDGVEGEQLSFCPAYQASSAQDAILLLASQTRPLLYALFLSDTSPEDKMHVVSVSQFALQRPALALSCKSLDMPQPSSPTQAHQEIKLDFCGIFKERADSDYKQVIDSAQLVMPLPEKASLKPLSASLHPARRITFEATSAIPSASEGVTTTKAQPFNSARQHTTHTALHPSVDDVFDVVENSTKDTQAAPKTKSSGARSSIEGQPRSPSDKVQVGDKRPAPLQQALKPDPSSPTSASSPAFAARSNSSPGSHQNRGQARKTSIDLTKRVFGTSPLQSPIQGPPHDQRLAADAANSAEIAKGQLELLSSITQLTDLVKNQQQQIAKLTATVDDLSKQVSKPSAAAKSPDLAAVAQSWQAQLHAMDEVNVERHRRLLECLSDSLHQAVRVNVDSSVTGIAEGAIKPSLDRIENVLSDLPAKLTQAVQSAVQAATKSIQQHVRTSILDSNLMAEAATRISDSTRHTLQQVFSDSLRSEHVPMMEGLLQDMLRQLDAAVRSATEDYLAQLQQQVQLLQPSDTVNQAVQGLEQRLSRPLQQIMTEIRSIANTSPSSDSRPATAPTPAEQIAEAIDGKDIVRAIRIAAKQPDPSAFEPIYNAVDPKAIASQLDITMKLAALQRVGRTLATNFDVKYKWLYALLTSTPASLSDEQQKRVILLIKKDLDRFMADRSIPEEQRKQVEIIYDLRFSV